MYSIDCLKKTLPAAQDSYEITSKQIQFGSHPDMPHIS